MRSGVKVVVRCSRAMAIEFVRSDRIKESRQMYTQIVKMSVINEQRLQIPSHFRNSKE